MVTSMRMLAEKQIATEEQMMMMVMMMMMISWSPPSPSSSDADIVLEADCDGGADVADDADVGGEADGENWKQGGPALQLQPHGAEIWSQKMRLFCDRGLLAKNYFIFDPRWMYSFKTPQVVLKWESR